ASVPSSNCHGRLVALDRPSTMAPATPKHAASMRSAWPPRRKRATTASRLPNSRLGSVCSRTSTSSVPCSTKSPSAVLVPPTSPARITTSSRGGAPRGSGSPTRLELQDAARVGDQHGVGGAEEQARVDHAGNASQLMLEGARLGDRRHRAVEDQVPVVAHEG